MKRHTRIIFLSILFYSILSHLPTIQAQDLIVDGDLYVRGNIELEDSIRLRDRMIWRGEINGLSPGEVAYIVIDPADDNYYWPDIEVSISGQWNINLLQGILAKRISLRHYNNGKDYGVRSEITADIGYISDKICIGEPIDVYDQQTTSGNYGDNGYVGLRIPIVYYNPSSGNDNGQIRVMVEFSKNRQTSGQPGNFPDWSPTIEGPVPYSTDANITTERIEIWKTRYLKGQIRLLEAQGDISMGPFGDQ